MRKGNGLLTQNIRETHERSSGSRRIEEKLETRHLSNYLSEQFIVADIPRLQIHTYLMDHGTYAGTRGGLAFLGTYIGNC